MKEVVQQRFLMICWEIHLTSESENEFEFIRQVHTDSRNTDDYD